MGNAPTKGLQHRNRGHKKYVHWDQAVPPWPPGKPHLAPGSPNTQPDVVTIRWDPPPDDGGAPITGYVVEHRKTGTPNWVRATTDLVLQPELRLSGLEPGWRYQFRVTAENAADLLSDPGELSQPLTVARAYRPATMAPQFSLELRDAIALENDKAEFLVHFHGIPTPKISWYKDSFEIFSSRRMRVTVDSDMSSLIIFQSAFSDEGVYKCTATNKAGHIITKAKLRLEAPPRIRIPRQYEDGLLFEKDEIIRFKVPVTGRPLPRVTWYHNHDPIPFGGRYEVTNTDRSSGLRISEAQRADRGEYQVRATSRLGEDIISFLVTVTDRPMPPGKTNVVSTQGRSVTLTWTEPDDDGGCKIGNYIVEYYRLGWNVWLKASTCRQMTTILGDLIEGSEYKFRVKAENPYGVSDANVESSVVFIPDLKRGLVDRPTRRSGSRDIPMPVAEQPPDKKREHKRSKDSLVGRDKETSEAKRREADRESVERMKLRSELMEKLEERRSVSQNDRSDLTKRRNRENFEKRTIDLLAGDAPEIVKKQRTMEVETAPPRASKPETEKGMKASLQFSVSKRRGSSGERDSGVSEESYSEGKQSFTSPLLPREDDSLLHGSSELMLVLLPQTGESQGERVRDQNSEFAIFGDSNVPPPMSLSAPELGSGEPLVMSLMRNAVSSTELLHEQAMARFYQAVAAEEAQKVKQRQDTMDGKPVEPSAADKTRVVEPEDVEMKELSKKLQAKTLEPLPKQELLWHQRKQRKFYERRDSFEAPPSLKRASPQPEIRRDSFEAPPSRKRASPQPEIRRDSFEAPPSIKRAPLQPDLDFSSLISRKGPVTLATEDEEEAVFQKVRQKAAEEKQPRFVQRSRNEGKASVATMKEREELEQAEEEEAKMEDEEECYEDEELEGEESVEEENSEFDEEEELYKSMEEEEETYHPNTGGARHIERFAEEEEEETYHPRSMVPRAGEPVRRSTERQHTPRPSNVVPKSILKHSSAFQDQLHHMVERNLERSPPKSFRESIPLSSFISDRSSRSPSPRLELQSPEPPEEEEEEEQDVGFREDEFLRSSPETPQFSPLSSSFESEPYYSEVEPVVPMPEPEAPSEPEPEPYYIEIEPIMLPLRPVAPVEQPVPEPEAEPEPEVEPEPEAEPIPEEEPKFITVEPIIPAEEPALSAAEVARQKRMLVRKASVEEDSEANKVVADYYGDIIRDHARPQKPIRRYLNTADLKAAAYASRRVEKKPPTPEPEPEPEPESEPEPELTVEQQIVKTELSAYDRYTAPVQRPSTPRRKSATPDLVLIRQSSRDRTRMPSTERFASQLSKQFPELKRRFSPEREETPRPEPLRPVTPKMELQLEGTERKWRSAVGYLADLAMFLVACWLYAFKDERLAIPVLALMVFRQLYAAIKRRMPKMPQLPWRRDS